MVPYRQPKYVSVRRIVFSQKEFYWTTIMFHSGLDHVNLTPETFFDAWIFNETSCFCNKQNNCCKLLEYHRSALCWIFLKKSHWNGFLKNFALIFGQANWKIYVQKCIINPMIFTSTSTTPHSFIPKLNET